MTLRYLTAGFTLTLMPPIVLSITLGIISSRYHDNLGLSDCQLQSMAMASLPFTRPNHVLLQTQLGQIRGPK